MTTNRRYGASHYIQLDGVGSIAINMDGGNMTRFANRLNSIRRNAEDLTDLFSDYASYMEDRIDETFRREGRSPYRWRPLAPSTVEDRRRKGYGPTSPILVRTRRLKNSIKVHHSRRSMTVRSDVRVRGSKSWSLLRIHNDGAPRANIPARKIIFLSGADMTILETKLITHLYG